MVTGGRNAIRSLFISSDEDEITKRVHVQMLQHQKSLLKVAMNSESGFAPSSEDCFENESFQNDDNNSDTDSNGSFQAVYLSVDKHDSNNQGIVIDKNYG